MRTFCRLILIFSVCSVSLSTPAHAYYFFSFWRKKAATYPNKQTFSYTGSLQSFTVPVGVTSLRLKLWGASGYPRYGCSGAGGYSSGDLTVTPGETIYVMVGGAGNSGTGGYGGGAGTGGGGAGGGRSAIFKGGSALANEVITAGGGGGGDDNTSGYAGAGGGLTGQGESNGLSAGGTQSSGGAGRGDGENGGPGGAGGGGYYGGGGGVNNGSGSGGSGYIGGVANGVTTAGNYITAPNTSDPDYTGSAGSGSCVDRGPAYNGLVIVRW